MTPRISEDVPAWWVDWNLMGNPVPPRDPNDDDEDDEDEEDDEDRHDAPVVIREPDDDE